MIYFLLSLVPQCHGKEKRTLWGQHVTNLSQPKDNIPNLSQPQPMSDMMEDEENWMSPDVRELLGMEEGLLARTQFGTIACLEPLHDICSCTAGEGPGLSFHKHRESHWLLKFRRWNEQNTDRIILNQ